ncbi:MAG: hypothetical protein WKF86_02580 [Acidimicrobiales bacterium]
MAVAAVQAAVQAAVAVQVLQAVQVLREPKGLQVPQAAATAPTALLVLAAAGWRTSGEARRSVRWDRCSAPAAR